MATHLGTTMKLRSLLSSLLTACTLLQAQRASAAEPEAVRLEVDARSGCVEEAALREEVATLGGHFRDANLDDRARTFRVEVERTKDHVKGRLIVRDLVFRENVREVNANDCAEATQSVALFIATALDEAPPPLSLAPAPITAPPAPWPAPTSTSNGDSLRVRAGRMGSGGVGVTGFAAKALSNDSAGLRAYAAMRLGRTTRLGVIATASHDSVERRNANLENHLSQGISKRAGLLIGWGAPWNDSVVGFLADVGAAWGDHHGVDYDAGLPRSAHWSFLSFYAAWQLVFQIPFESPVRPIAAFGTSWVPSGPAGVSMGGLIGVTAETGIVWQAW